MSPSSTPRPRIRRARPGARGHGITLVHRWRLQRSIVTCSYSRNTRGASWAAHRAISPAAPGATARRGSDSTPSADDVNLTATCRGLAEGRRTCVSGSSSFSPEARGSAGSPRPHPCLGRAARAGPRHARRVGGGRAPQQPPTRHVHLVVRGAPRSGRSRSRSAYLSGGLRRAEAASWRRRSSVFRSGRGAPGRPRPRGRAASGSRDRSRAPPGGRCPRPGGPTRKPRAGTRSRDVARLQELRRLHFLEGLGLATKVGARVWQAPADARVSAQAGRPRRSDREEAGAPARASRRPPPPSRRDRERRPRPVQWAGDRR